jgi:hypothetical protein
LRQDLLDVRGSVHHSKIHKEKSNKIQQCTKILLLHIYMKLNMFRVTPPIIRSVKLNWLPPVFHTWKVVGHVVGERCQGHTVPDNVHQLHVEQPFMYEKPEAVSAVLGS